MDWIIFLVFLAASFVAATTGGLFPPGVWYQTLRKPSWTPPNWMFPVVWTSLYIAMSLAAARVAVNAETVAGASLAFGFWTLQITLNALWSPVFFGLQRLKLAMGILVALWLAVAGAIWSHWQVDMIAGALLLPYLLWVTIAGGLNASVIRLNPTA